MNAYVIESTKGNRPAVIEVVSVMAVSVAHARQQAQSLGMDGAIRVKSPSLGDELWHPISEAERIERSRSCSR